MSTPNTVFQNQSPKIPTGNNDLEHQLASKISAALKQPKTKTNRLLDALERVQTNSLMSTPNPAPEIRAEDFHFPAHENSPSDDSSPARQTPPPLPTDSPSGSGISKTNILETTRRARHRKNARQAGSWIITLTVTLFITACVSILLLGVPKSLDPKSWITAHATNTAVSQPAKTSSTDKTTAPIR